MSSDGAPNKILFVQNLPAATTDAMLAMLFQQFPGYVETRMVEVRALTPPAAAAAFVQVNAQQSCCSAPGNAVLNSWIAGLQAFWPLLSSVLVFNQEFYKCRMVVLPHVQKN